MKKPDIFKKTFEMRFWKKLKETLVDFNPGEFPRVTERDKYLEKLYSDLKTRRYITDVPREYIVFDKHNLVSRIVPCFSVKDYCVYFYCISQLEKYIADPNDRVPGTFGGWRLNTDLSEAEKNDVSEQEVLYMAGADSVALNSYNPIAWRKHWKEFQQRAYEFSTSFAENNITFYCIKFDIANFYDTINLSSLRRNIQLICKESDLEDEIEILFSLLYGWNRRFEGYSKKCVGIPQDEVQDCSRILANFYLRKYDNHVYALCQQSGSKFLRYADDQLIFTSSLSEAKRILFSASKQLHAIGLNVNSSKVKIFSSVEEFKEYWAFDIFYHLSDNDLNNPDNVERALELHFMRSGETESYRKFSVTSRLLLCEYEGVDPSKKLRFFSEILEENFILKCSHQQLYKIYTLLDIVYPKNCTMV